MSQRRTVGTSDGVVAIWLAPVRGAILAVRALGNGMTTYQISFHALAPLGETAAPMSLDRVGLHFAVLPGDAAVILAEGQADRLVVSQHSPVGAVGQVITITGQITVTPVAGGAPRTFAVLEIDQKAIGLVATGAEEVFQGTDPVTLEIAAVAAAPPGMAPPKVAEPATTKPRKSPLAFALGTRIDTPDGPRRVETLVPGDLITTLDNGSQPLRWAGRRLVTPADMMLRDDLQPLRLEAAVLGNDRALLISPRHRILLNDWRAQVYFGEDQVLVPAQALINGLTVRQVLPLAGVTYVHLLFDRHEVILSEGALSESFHPGETGLGALDPSQRQEIEVLFPGEALERRRAAFPMLRMAEARALRLPG